MSRQAKQTALVENQWKNWHFYLLFIALSFVFYGSTLKNKYAMDDDLVTTTYQYNEDGSRELISRHPNVEKGFSGIPSILTSHFAVNKKQRYGYRPVVTAVFAIEYQLFGSNPAISHFLIRCFTHWCYFDFPIFSDRLSFGGQVVCCYSGSVVFDSSVAF